MITIVPYDLKYQAGVDTMMEGIQEEFSERITNSHSAKLLEAAKQPGQKYWVALDDEKVVGTMGVVFYEGNTAVVKRMMVDKDYRGKVGVSQKLLDTGIKYSRENGATGIALGTMGQFIAAQKFYTKNGFKEIGIEELPGDYQPNPIDSLHYRLELH